MSRIRVLVVDDSLTIRRRLVEILRADQDLEVIGEAGDGKHAIELCEALRPDVITLDMMLPILTGVAATEYIMAYCPTPILIVSSSTNRGEIFKTYDALAAGAVDVLEKPSGLDREGKWEAKLVATVKLVSRVAVITHLRRKLATSERHLNGRRNPFSQAPELEEPSRLVAIGASTGGPGAVLELLRGLPATFPLPILILIHISPRFADGLAEWLDRQSELRVTCAIDGEPLPCRGDGRVILAGPDRHLVIEAGKLRLASGPRRNFCRPSIDVMFESIAQEVSGHSIACLLTGMGSDGARGLLAIRQAGGTTIAQDEATSIIYGMPREAVILDAARLVLPLSQIAPALTALAESRDPATVRRGEHHG